MSRYITLTLTKGDQGWSKSGGNSVEINPDHVAAVFPRRSYTTLLVGGHYVHVVESIDAVHDLLEWG